MTTPFFSIIVPIYKTEVYIKQCVDSQEICVVGMNCHIYSDLATSESYLIEIGDNVTISNGVQFITHDNSVCKVMPQFTNIFGRIKIGENSFIGAKSIVMMGVNIPANTIVGAGSVVTRSFVEERTIIAGNPARIIGNWDAYESKFSDLAVDISGFAG